MLIESGLFPHQVLQRAGDGRCDQPIAGTCAAAGPVLATVRCGRRTVLAGTTVGQARAGRFTARLRCLPAGGPYRIELAVGGCRLLIDDVLVGDVWLLAGQSNMQGIGLLAEATSKPHRAVRCHYPDDRWALAVEPLHRLWEAVDAVHHQLGAGEPRATGAGPGLPFALAMRRRTGVPQGLIACAHGGTFMAQWDAALADQGGASLYGALLRRLRRDGGGCAGLVWYQGENETIGEPWKVYTAAMTAWVAALRRNLRAPHLPVAMVQLGRHVDAGGQESWNGMQEQQRRLPERIRHLAVVPSIDLALDDPIHIGGRAQAALGERLAEAMQVLRDGPGRDRAAPISVGPIAVEDVRGNGFLSLRVRFAHLRGGLVSAGPALGFSLATPGRTDGDGVARVELEGDSALIHTTRTKVTLPGSLLWYGHGRDSRCTVGDRAGRSLPVFGPLLAMAPEPVSPFLPAAEVAFAPAQDLATAVPPGDGLVWTRRAFPAQFANLRDAIVAHGAGDAVVWWRCRLHCPEAMPVRLRLGYDGPVRVWLDGHSLHHDPAGSNPALVDAHRLPERRLAAGDHAIVIALGTNHGRAWGIFLRAERTRLPRQAANPVLPAWSSP